MVFEIYVFDDWLKVPLNFLVKADSYEQVAKWACSKYDVIHSISVADLQQVTVDFDLTSN